MQRNDGEHDTDRVDDGVADGGGDRRSSAPAAGDPITAIEQAGDAPVELTVELARLTLPLEEIGALRAGEVLATGRAIGERVTLRAGGRAIAQGELVDVDGEVGVRILADGG